VKPKYKRSREEENESNDQDENDEIQPCTKIRVESGPQDPPKLSVAKLYGSIHKLLPNACLFTIVEPPTTEDPPVFSCSTSIELNQQSDVIPVSSDITVERPQSSDISHNCDTVTVQLCGVNTPQTSEGDGLPEPSNAQLDVCTTIIQQSESTSMPPEERQQNDSVGVLEAVTEALSSNHDLTSCGPLADKETSSFIELPSPLTDHFRSACIDSQTDIANTAKQLFYSLKLSKDECQSIEVATSMQRDSEEWFQQREGRLTASTFHNILNMRKQTDPTAVAKRFLNKQDLSHIPAIRWGISNEERARQDYVITMSSHIDFECTSVGLVVNPVFPHLGASPDGLVTCKCCHGSGLVELKCPYSVRNAHPNTLREKSQSCLSEVGMATSHSYYTQVQGQLLITGKEYCDFVVWTPEGIVTDRVYQDFNFTEKLLRKLTTFYVDFMIPAIVGLTVEQQIPDYENIVHDEDEVYCFCQQPEHGKMIMCEGSACPYVWFHYDCVGIKRAKSGSWYCNNCK